MKYFLLSIFAIWIIGGIISWLVDRIRESIEDKVIKKSRLKEDLKTSSEMINANMDIKVEQTKTNITSLRELAFQRFPGLKERMARDDRRLNYIKNYLPYYKNQHKRRRI